MVGLTLRTQSDLVLRCSNGDTRLSFGFLSVGPQQTGRHETEEVSPPLSPGLLSWPSFYHRRAGPRDEQYVALVGRVLPPSCCDEQAGKSFVVGSIRSRLRVCLSAIAHHLETATLALTEPGNGWPSVIFGRGSCKAQNFHSELTSPTFSAGAAHERFAQVRSRFCQHVSGIGQS